MVRVPLPPQSRFVKKVLPRTLLGRSLLIILIPLVLTLAVALQIFYGSHLNIVSRRFTGAVAGEIAATIDLLSRFPDASDRAWILGQAADEFELNARIEIGARLPPPLPQAASPFDWLSTVDDDLAAASARAGGAAVCAGRRRRPAISAGARATARRRA